MPSSTVETWHHGLVAKWWGAFNVGGADAAFFKALALENGGPTLDLGCGAGRVLLPILETGHDIEGLDASADMLAECRRIAAQRGLSPTLHLQPMHELDLELRFQTIFICGSFGLGAGRREDFATIRRCYEQLRPGGLLALDLYLPTSNERSWLAWIKQRELPASWPEQGERRPLPDGSELELRFRMVAFDPIEQWWRGELRLVHRDGERVLADEIHSLSGILYFKGEISTMLEAAGFSSVAVQAGVEARAPIPFQDHYLVLSARRPR